MKHDGDAIYLNSDEAVSVLPDGDTIHTFLNPLAGAMLGADWDRSEVVEAITKSPCIHLTGPMARSMKHGLAIEQGDRYVFIETDEQRLVELEEKAKITEVVA